MAPRSVTNLLTVDQQISVYGTGINRAQVIWRPKNRKAHLDKAMQ